jgi:putative methionine-R-sulfoxide reductase with GAF domain
MITVVAVLDIDSPKHARFTAEVQKEIEAVVDVLATLNW